MRALAVAVIAVLLLCSAAEPALAQTQGPSAPGAGSPFAPLPQAPQATPPQTQTQTAPRQPGQTTTSDSGPSTLGVFGLFAGGILVIVLIGYFIMRDARRTTGVRGRRRPQAPATLAAARRGAAQARQTARALTIHSVH